MLPGGGRFKRCPCFQPPFGSRKGVFCSIKADLQFYVKAWGTGVSLSGRVGDVVIKKFKWLIFPKVSDCGCEVIILGRFDCARDWVPVEACINIFLFRDKPDPDVGIKSCFQIRGKKGTMARTSGS